jgi:hypothetical protein
MEMWVMAWDRHGNVGDGLGQAWKCGSWPGTGMEMWVMAWDRHGNVGHGLGQTWKCGWLNVI